MTSIVDLYATILPETSKIADGVVRAFREVDPAAAEAGRRWGREIQRGLGEANIELKADTAKAKAEIDEAAKDKKATVEVNADTAKAEAQIDIAARDRKATIEVDADTMVASVQRSVSGMAPAMAGAGTQLSQSLAGAGAAAAPSVGGSLAGAMAPVGTALTVALVGGAVTAAAGVAGALSGAIGLIPAGLGGGIAVLGTLVTGLDGVKDAWDAAGKAADSANKDQAEKAKAVASAQKTLRDAVFDEANAQKDVANARKDARQQLEDLNVQLRGGVIDEKSAILDAEAARQDLATGRYKDAIEYQQAQLRVQQADQRVLEAHQRNVELQEKATDANAKGVEQSDQVVAANQRLAKAHEDVALAQTNLSEAQKKTSSNTDALATAMGKISPGAQAFLGSLRQLKPAWDQLKFSVQDSLFAGLGPQIQSLATQYMPVLKSAMTGLAGTMNSAFKDVSGWLSKPETLTTIQQIIANIGTSFQAWSGSLVPFSNAFLTITKVGSDFLPSLGKAVTDGANAFDRFIQKAAASGDLGKWMQTGIQALGELMRLLPIVGQLFLDLAPLAVPVLREIGDLLLQLSPLLQVTVGLLAQHPGLISGVVVAFATWKSITAVDTVLTALEGISAALKVLPAEAATAGTGMSAALAPILGTLTTAATALALFNSHGDSAPTNIGPGADERQRKLNAGKAYADAHGGKVPDGYAQWLDKGGPMPAELGQYYVAGAAPGTPQFDSQGRPLNAQGKPFGGSTAPPNPTPYNPNMPKSTVPGITPTAPYMPSAGPSGLTGDAALTAALQAKGFGPQLIRLIQGFSKVEGNNPAGIPTLGFTDAQLGGKTDLQSHVDALAQQFKSRAAVAGPFPEFGTDQQQAEWIAKVVGQSGLAADWQGNSQPKDYTQRVVSAMAGSSLPPGFTPWFGGGGTPTLPGAAGSGGTPVFVTNWPGGGFGGGFGPAVPGVAAAAPTGGAPAAGDASLLAGVPSGRYLQTQAADLTKGIGDCSSAVEDLINMMDGVSTAGRQMSTGNATQWLTAHGFVPTDKPMPGTFQVGFSSSHMQATLPGGTNFNWGSDAAAAGRGVGGTGAWDPSFTSHFYRPAGLPNVGGMYPSAAGMPTIASPQGVSPEGLPLGTQNSPMYVMPAQPSGGQQLGQDFVSGIAEVFGFDGSLFKNPMDTGLFKGFKGLMSFLTGGGKGGRGQGMPASYWQAQGGDGSAMPAMGGGDLFAGLGGMLTGIMPQPFGQIGKGGPAQAPDEFQPMLPGSGGNATLPSTFTPSGNKTVGGPQIDQSINIGTVNGRGTDIHQTMVDVNVPRARQSVGSIPGMN
ncbi:hypothetical protein [Mycobacterium intracellulare]|uniref:hypothetical protein n=1 Tax=Mycobacterium intracellulare TaxID=1767 RepID=UPI00080B1653|nr:hypothetical protein [Mycobacterium intracellulare]OCB15075.1 hypothetical protein A5689_26845 [Mycobacterium intracellulare subsp. yongonense]